jgi:hypothetical protein
VVPLHRRFLGRQPRRDRRERLGDVDRRIAGPAARPLLSLGAAEDDDGQDSDRHSGPKISVEARSLRSIKLSNFAETSEVRRPPGPIARPPATLPTSPIGRAIQHDRARGGLNVDQPRPWSASGYVPHARSGQCPSPLAEWRTPYSWEPSAVQTYVHCSNAIRAEKFHRRPFPDSSAPAENAPAARCRWRRAAN